MNTASATYKIALIGEPGAGKTTCIAAVSDIAPVVTDVACTDELAQIKETTTVAMDYGEMALGNGERLLLYGLPGQTRFRFMLDAVRNGLVGLVVLVDARAPDPMKGLAETVDAYADALQALPCVVVVNKPEGDEQALLARVQTALRQRQLVAPIIAADVRNKDEMALIFELIFLCAEYGDV
ncbi:GTP-binding protein [Xanthomonas massiliensis]|uniref:GTP-binding protein n=1 Tax=Xanthomonas massiliensis TaxID=1720302 RepID=UPI0008268AB8|nr:ATP/GTP-binding protein [Xanthomonas massiliensis]